MLRSPLMSIVTSPRRNQAGAAIRMNTSESTMAVKHPDAEDDFGLFMFVFRPELNAREGHEAQRHQADGDEGNAQACRPSGTSLY